MPNHLSRVMKKMMENKRDLKMTMNLLFTHPFSLCKFCIHCYVLTIVLYYFSKISQVTIEFLVLGLVEMNRLSFNSHLARGNYHMSLKIVLQKEVSEGDWTFLLDKLSYWFQSPIGIIILTKWHNCFSKSRLYF